MMDGILSRPLLTIGHRSSRVWIPEWARLCLNLGCHYLLFPLGLHWADFLLFAKIVTAVPRPVTLVEVMNFFCFLTAWRIFLAL